ncbi:MAG TPA: hypothetical protein PKK32_01750, partial [Candidatus Paceibacterota bacterium]|nr:hypothetical protein [Candidatus Paceibacterota bacterium]
MIIEQFITTKEWQELKGMMKEEFGNTPLKIKTEGMTAEQIAIEVRASQIAYAKLDKFIKKLDRQANQNIKKETLVDFT